MLLPILLASFSIVFRFDDMHEVNVWADLAREFDARELKMSLALPLDCGGFNDAQRAFLQQAAKNGHELMDHTIEHSLFYYRCIDDAEFKRFSTLPIVSSADPKTREIKFKCNRDEKLCRKFVGSITNGVLFTKNGESAKFTRPTKIIVPSLGKGFGFYASPDGNLRLYDMEICRKLPIGAVPDVHDEEMILAPINAFSIGAEVMRFQAERAREWFERSGFPRPRSWIQPGGWSLYMKADENFLRTYGCEFGYDAASCPGPAGRYSFLHRGFLDNDSYDIARIKQMILEAKTKDEPICLLSHTWLPKRLKANGGWPQFVKELAEILDWVKAENLPVKTFAAAALEHAWSKYLKVPAGYDSFEHSAKLTNTIDRGEYIIEEYSQANGPKTFQRVQLALPKAASGKLPAIVLPFYHPEAIPGYVEELTKRGYAVISAEAYHLTQVKSELQSGDLARWQLAADALHRDWPAFTGMGKLVFDTRLLIDMLEADKRIDANRIGIFGHSLGGKMAYYTGCLDKRIKVIVTSDFGLPWDSTNWNADWYFGGELEKMKTEGLSNEQLLTISMGKPFFLLAGKYDDERSFELMRKAGGYFGKPDMLGGVNHASGHRPPPSAREAGYDFLDKCLKRTK